MIKAPIRLQELRRRIYHKAKSEATHRFWGLFVHVTKLDTLHEAYRVAKRNGGAAGSDGQTFAAIEQAGRGRFLAELQQELLSGSYQPQANRRVDIPKGNGKARTLQIPMACAYCISSPSDLGIIRVGAVRQGQIARVQTVAPARNGSHLAELHLTSIRVVLSSSQFVSEPSHTWSPLWSEDVPKKTSPSVY